MDELFVSLKDRFQPDKAEGLDAVYQFDLSGPNGGKYWLKVANKQVEGEEGEHPSPTITLLGNADDFLAMFNGDLNPMVAMMQGKVKVRGDMSYAIKLQAILGL